MFVCGFFNSRLLYYFVNHLFMYSNLIKLVSLISLLVSVTSREGLCPVMQFSRIVQGEGSRHIFGVRSGTPRTFFGKREKLHHIC